MDGESAVAQMKEVFRVLSADINKICTYENFVNDEAAHRSLIRAHFAFIEGMVYQLRSIALASDADLSVYSAEEISVLREKNYFLNQKGGIERQDSFERILPMMLFSMRAYAKLHRTTFSPDTGAHGWEAMRKYVKIRNALTHPKTLDDLVVNKEKTEISSAANEWFQRNLTELFRVCEEGDRAFMFQPPS